MKYKFLCLAISGLLAYPAHSYGNDIGSRYINFQKCINISGDSIKSLKQLSGKYVLIETSTTDSSAFQKDREQYFMDIYSHYKDNGFEWITINNSKTSSLTLINPEGIVCATEKQLKGSGLEKTLRLLIPEVPIYETINTEEFNNLTETNKDIQIVDVRTKEEYDKGSVENAVLIDVKKIDFKNNADSLLDKSKDILVFCKGGVRSRKAAWILTDKGFNVYNLDKGYDSLITPESSVIIAAKMEIKADSIKSFKDIAKPLIEATKQEKGCIKYSLYQDSCNPSVFFFFEEYKNEEAYIYHSKQKYLEVFKERRAPMLVSKPDAVIYNSTRK